MVVKCESCGMLAVKNKNDLCSVCGARTTGIKFNERSLYEVFSKYHKECSDTYHENRLNKMFEERVKTLDKEHKELKTEFDGMILIRDMLKDLIDRNIEKRNKINEELVELIKG